MSAVIRSLIAMIVTLGAAGTASAEQPCANQDPSKVFAPDRKPLAPAAFDAVRLDMTVWEIIEVLGPAHRELGSGLMIFEWKSADGRSFRVGGTSMCKRPIYAHFAEDVPK